MFVTVVVAHPAPESFSHAVADRAVAGLRAAGHDVEVLDLYGLGFRVAMSADEREAYHTDTPILDPIVAAHTEIVRRSQALVFVYPTWWSGLPAIMKGWLERVMVPGVAFRLHERSGKVRPGLGHVRHLIGISTYGSPRGYVRVINDNGRRTITRALRMSCGWRVRTRWLGLYSVDTSTAIDREEFAAGVERAMSELR